MDPLDIFISHHSRDVRKAEALKELLDRVFLGTHRIFLSSDLAGGTNWLDAIREAITRAPLTIVLVTKTSRKRPWVWFELGAAWHADACLIPLRARNAGDLPYPLNSIVGRLLSHHGLAMLCQDIGGRCGASVDFKHAKAAAKDVFGRL